MSISSPCFEEATAVAQQTLDGPPDEQPDAVLVYRSVAAVMVEAMRRRVDHVFSRGVVTLADLWELGNREAMVFNVTPGFEATLWENLGILLYAIGALAVHWEIWPREFDSDLVEPLVIERLRFATGLVRFQIFPGQDEELRVSHILEEWLVS